MLPKDPRARPVPTGRLSRLFSLGGLVAGVAGRMAVDGAVQLAQGKRPDLADVLLTPVNAMRFANSLTHLRGAAMKLGQMLSMDVGLILPPALTDILAQLRQDAKPMPAAQLQSVLSAAWSKTWRQRFTHFDMNPFAAASIGQVHRATTLDGRNLAIKVQYPGVRTSIDSDVDNIATLMRIPGVLPRGLDIAPMLAQAKRVLHQEADYAAEARHLTLFAAHLQGNDAFIVPAVHADFSTANILAMTYIESQPLEQLTTAPKATRDHVAASLIDLVLQELFDFGAMQTDPNLANYRYQSHTGRIVLLDFGAVQTIAPELTAKFRTLLNAALSGMPTEISAAMQSIGYFDNSVSKHHQALILAMFNVAVAPLQQSTPFDFGQTDLAERLRDMGLAIGNERDLTHVPPPETLFLHRKIGGMYLLATKLRAQVALRPMLERYR
jgi:predicted unusual protein kinase regulating ubiquinone biosynthesis (AarF/ABC1/UbiB family)